MGTFFTSIPGRNQKRLTAFDVLLFNELLSLIFILIFEDVMHLALYVNYTTLFVRFCTICLVLVCFAQFMLSHVFLILIVTLSAGLFVVHYTL